MSRFLGHGVRTGLPNSVDRNLDWNHLMEIRAVQNQKTVEKPGKTSKVQFEVDEVLIVQNVKSKKWDKEGIITEVRTAHDGKIVSYHLLINGYEAIRHRRYLRKKVDTASEDSEPDESADSQTSSEPAREQGPRRSSRNLRQQ